MEISHAPQRHIKTRNHKNFVKIRENKKKTNSNFLYETQTLIEGKYSMERRTKIGISTMIFIISLTIAVSLGMTLPKKSSVDQNDIDFEEEIEAGNLTKVNSVNFDYAETIANYRDVYKKMRLFGKDVNSFMHLRNKAPAGDDFPIVRPNFDTLYSVGIMDTHMGPVEVSQT